MRASHRGGVVLAFALAACSRSHENSSLDIRHRSNAALEDGGAADAASPDGKPSPAAFRAGDYELWIGELWSIAHRTPDGTIIDVHAGTVLCTPDPGAGDGIGMPVDTDPTGYVERTVLSLEHANDPDVGGRIQFGEGAPPTSPGDEPFAPDGPGDTYWGCSNDRPTRGFAYALHDAKRYPDRMTFSIVPSEVWDAWCATQTTPCGGRDCPSLGPICDCSDAGCKSAPPEETQWTQRLDFNLAITTDTIEGALPGSNAWGATSDLRLRRAR